MAHRPHTAFWSAANWFSWSVAVLLLAALLGLAAGLHWTLERAETRALDRHLDAIVAQVEADLYRAAAEQSAILERMALRLSQRSAPDRAAWSADAQRLMADFPYYYLLAVVDADLRVRWLESRSAARLDEGQQLPIGTGARRQLAAAGSEAGTMVLEPLLVGTGQAGLLFMTPIASRTDGQDDAGRWLASVLVVPEAVAAALDAYYLDDVVLEGRFAGTRFVVPPDALAARGSRSFVRSLAVQLDDGQSTFVFDIALRTATREALATGLPQTVLGLGAVLAVLVSVAALLAMAAARQAQGLAQANRTLNDEIHDRELAEQELEFLLTHDSLTGLPNRQGMLESLTQALQRFTPGRALAVLYLDLDRFKDINETLGHHLGDELLRQLPGRIGDALDPADRLGRLGGDEFLIVAERASGGGVRRLAEGLLQCLNDAFQLDEHQLFVTASVGFALYDGRQSPSELVQNADAALFRAKHLGRNQVAQFTPEMFRAVQQRLVMSRDIRSAIDSGQFEVVYQPIVDLRSLEMRGVEALLRWSQPDGRVIPPRDFIRVAEETGLVHRLSQLAVRQAFDDLAGWWREFGHGPWLAVNISGAQFREPRFVPELQDMLEQAGLRPDQVHLEITEDVLIENLARNRAVLDQLDEIGLKLVVDDFGVGYSSMAYIKNFPVSTIKIDQGFVRDLEIDRDDQAITRTICNLSSALRLDTVAEGIEHPAQLEALRSYGCPLGQGYLFLEASGPDIIREILAGHRPWAERAAVAMQ